MTIKENLTPAQAQALADQFHAELRDAVQRNDTAAAAAAIAKLGTEHGRPDLVSDVWDVILDRFSPEQVARYFTTTMPGTPEPPQ